MDTRREDDGMEKQPTNMIAKKVSWYEGMAFLFIILMTWIDEILDIPFLILGAPSTPINWRESLFESVIIAIIGAVIIRYTYNLLTKISYLEAILPVCASCQKIRLDPAFWDDIKLLIKDRADKEFVHGVCPDCIDKYYPELKHKHGGNGAE